MRRAISFSRGQGLRQLSTSEGGAGAAGRGRGKGALNSYINSHRDTVKGFQQAGPGGGGGARGDGGKGGGGGGKGPSFGKGGGGGGKGQFGKGGGRGGGKGKGKGGKGMSREDAGSYKPQVFKFESLQPGQFDDAEGGVGTTTDAVNAIIEATFESPDGLIIFDYNATDKENAKVAERFDQSNPRTIEQLLDYSELKEALGDEEAAAAQPFLHDAWAVQAANPYITHQQRVEVAKHIEANLADIVNGNRGYLEYALTPPEDYVG